MGGGLKVRARQTEEAPIQRHRTQSDKKFALSVAHEGRGSAEVVPLGHLSSSPSSEAPALRVSSEGSRDWVKRWE
eukprot:9478551-Pyramimonas_sp.AAC.1